MATRGVPTVVTYRAWDTSANTPKTGDVANHTLRWIKDGTSAAPTNAATAAEVDATNAPGVYKLTLTATETDCTFGVLAGKSGTANVVLYGVSIGFEYVPTSSTTFGAFIGNATAALVVDGSGHVTAGTVSDKTGYSLTQAFPANFADLAITATTGKVTVGTNSDKTGYSISGTTTTLDALQTHGDSSWATATGFAVAGDAMTLTAAYDFAKGTVAMTESYAANGVAPTPIQALYALHQDIMCFSISGTSYTVKKLDGTTTAYTVTLDDATSPTSATR